MYDCKKTLFRKQGGNCAMNKDVYELLILLASKKGNAYYSTSLSTDLLFIKKLNGKFDILQEIIPFFKR